jgi:hypothetical protein
MQTGANNPQTNSHVQHGFPRGCRKQPRKRELFAAIGYAKMQVTIPAARLMQR